jgi:hypothetical protein
MYEITLHLLALLFGKAFTSILAAIFAKVKSVHIYATVYSEELLHPQ